MAESTSTTVAAVIEKRVSGIVTETLIQDSVMLGALRDFSSQVGPGMDRLDIPDFNALAIQDVSESAEVTPQTINPTTAQLTLNRHKSIPFFISDRASVQAKAQLVMEAVKNGARSLAAEIDDYMLGLVDANAAQRDALTADPLADMAQAKKYLDDANVPKQGRYIVASPGFVQSLLGTNNLIRANEYGSASGIQAGYISDIYGFRVLESSSSSVIDDGFHAFQMDGLAFARQIQPSLKSEYKVLKHGWDYSLSHLYGGQYTTANRMVVFDADGL
jgi:hypothetical protein